MFLILVINTIIMSNKNFGITSMNEVENNYYNYVPGKQRNFEFLKLCPYELYINLYYEPKRIENEVLDLSIKTPEKIDEIFFKEEESESIETETIQRVENENKKDESEESEINLKLSIDEILVLILFILGFCYVVYVLVSFSDILSPVGNFILAVYRVFTWPMRMIAKFVKNIFTSRNIDQVIIEEPEKLPDAAGL